MIGPVPLAQRNSVGEGSYLQPAPIFGCLLFEPTKIHRFVREAR